MQRQDVHKDLATVVRPFSRTQRALGVRDVRAKDIRVAGRMVVATKAKQYCDGRLSALALDDQARADNVPKPYRLPNWVRVVQD